MATARTPVDKIIAETRWFPAYLMTLAALVAVFVVGVEGAGAPRLASVAVAAVVLLGLWLVISRRRAVPRGGHTALILALVATGVLYVLAVAPLDAWLLSALSPGAALGAWVVTATVVALPLVVAARRFARR